MRYSLNRNWRPAQAIELRVYRKITDQQVLLHECSISQKHSYSERAGAMRVPALDRRLGARDVVASHDANVSELFGECSIAGRNVLGATERHANISWMAVLT